MHDLNELIVKILDKKDLKSLDRDFILKVIGDESQRNKALFSRLEEKGFNPRSKEFGEFKKIVRKKLRSVYGMFARETLSPEKRQRLLESLRKAVKHNDSQESDRIVAEILQSHLSTSERCPYYDVIYPEIFRITGQPKKIIDLGCGLNPLSYEFLKIKPYYVASDIGKKDMEFIGEFFKIMGIKGETIQSDLTNPDSTLMDKANDADICLLLKLVDTLEDLKRDSAKKLIANLSTKNIVLSVPKATISGKKPIRSNRNWLQKVIENKEKQGWRRHDFETSNEHFTVLNK